MSTLPPASPRWQRVSTPCFPDNMRPGRIFHEWSSSFNIDRFQKLRVLTKSTMLHLPIEGGVSSNGDHDSSAGRTDNPYSGAYVHIFMVESHRSSRGRTSHPSHISEGDTKYMANFTPPAFAHAHPFPRAGDTAMPWRLDV